VLLHRCSAVVTSSGESLGERLLAQAAIDGRG
jgi:hypothetical protein